MASGKQNIQRKDVDRDSKYIYIASSMTADDHRLRNRIRNRLSKVRDRATLEKLAALLRLDI